ncbi:MAG: flagellar basal body rod C-terminal domain-containing protein [Alphaproteobacteria bacterium]
MLSTAVPLSGMQVASMRLTASASNIANVNSDGALPDASGTVPVDAQTVYQPVQIQQSSMAMENGQGAMTVGTVRNVAPSYVAAYDPDASYANEDGLVASPNVDMATEMLNLTTAKMDFKLNVITLQTINDMVDTLYELDK